MRQMGRKNLLCTRKRAITLAVCIAAVAALTILFFKTAEYEVSKAFPDCMLRTVTGLRCVLCGGTRCVREILKGDLATAFYYNPYVVVCAFAAVKWYIRLIVSIFQKEYKPLRIRKWHLWAALISMLLFWVVRNFEFYRNIFY